MNARVLLLILVTALFMGVWDGDQAVMQTAIAKRNLQKQAAIAAKKAQRSTVDSADVKNQSVKQIRTVSATSASHGSGAVDRCVNELFPLPATLPAGRYQAVSQTGELTQITVTRETEASVARDLYVVDARSGDRWYLIRLQ